MKERTSNRSVRMLLLMNRICFASLQVNEYVIRVQLHGSGIEMVVVVAYFSLVRIFERRLDYSIPACAFFFSKWRLAREH